MVDDIIDRYADCPARLEEALSGLSEQELDQALSHDSWSIRQYVHHIVDGDELWKLFIKQAMGNPQDHYSIDWYLHVPQDEWAVAWHYTDRAIAPSLALLGANRAYIVELLRQIPGALGKRLGVALPNGGTEEGSVRDIVELQIRHIDEHIADIQKILEARRTTGKG